MIRRVTCAVVGGAVAIAGLGVAPASAVPVPTLYKLPYADALFTATVDDQGTELRNISFEEWQQFGFPAYQVLAPRYYKSSFSSMIYAVTDLPGTQYDQFPDALSYAEWASVGFPTPENGNLQVVQYVQYTTSPELFAASPEPPQVKLSYAQWKGVGFPAPEVQPFGFYKLTWDDHIVRSSRDGLESSVLGLEDWAAFGYPTPLSSARLTGDRFFFATGSTDVITYQGPSFSGPITYAQWSAAGFPAPEAYVPAADVVFGSPADGSVPASLLPAVSGTGEPAGEITFTVGSGGDAQEVGTATVDPDGNWTATLDLTGRYGEQVTVSATQVFAGKDDEQDALSLDLNLGLAVTAPGPDAIVSRWLTMTGTGRPGATITLTWGNHPNDEYPDWIGAPVVAPDGTWTADVDLTAEAPRSTWLNATAPDQPRAQVAVQVATVVDLISIDGGNAAQSLRPTIAGTGEAGASVVLYAGEGEAAVEVGSTTVELDGGWSATADLSDRYGQLVVVTAVQSLPGGGTSSDGVQLDMTLGYRIASPADGATGVAPGTVVVTGTGAPGTTAHIHVVDVDGIEWGIIITEPVTEDGTWQMSFESTSIPTDLQRVRLYDSKMHRVVQEIAYTLAT